MTDFYAKQEVNDLYKQMKKKPYSKKEPWEKFLNNTSRNRKKQKKIREYEIPYEMDRLSY